METETVQISSSEDKNCPKPAAAGRDAHAACPATSPHGGLPNFSDPGSQTPSGAAETDSPWCSEHRWGDGSSPAPSPPRGQVPRFAAHLPQDHTQLSFCCPCFLRALQRAPYNPFIPSPVLCFDL